MYLAGAHAPCPSSALASRSVVKKADQKAGCWVAKSVLSMAALAVALMAAPSVSWSAVRWSRAHRLPSAGSATPHQASLELLCFLQGSPPLSALSRWASPRTDVKHSLFSSPRMRRAIGPLQTVFACYLPFLTVLWRLRPVKDTVCLVRTRTCSERCCTERC